MGSIGYIWTENIAPIMDGQVEKKMEHDMGTELIWRFETSGGIRRPPDTL